MDDIFEMTNPQKINFSKYHKSKNREYDEEKKRYICCLCNKLVKYGSMCTRHHLMNLHGL